MESYIIFLCEKKKRPMTPAKPHVPEGFPFYVFKIPIFNQRHLGKQVDISDMILM